MNETASAGLVSYRDLLTREMGAYLELTKPRLTLLAVLSTLWGFYMAARGPINFAALVHTLWAAFLVGGGANALNQFFERETDRKMKRTETRPLPTGRLTEEQAFNFGLVISVVGFMHLAVFVGPLASSIALAVLFTYLILYTPLKKRSSAAVFVGAIPGALPPVMGWAAAEGSLAWEAWILFALLFIWQIPHFLAIAWLYRDDYRAADLPVLAAKDSEGKGASTRIAFYSMILLLASLLPYGAGMAGRAYLCTALGAGILFSGMAFLRSLWGPALYARRMFLASVFYLPLLMIVMVWDRL